MLWSRPQGRRPGCGTHPERIREPSWSASTDMCTHLARVRKHSDFTPVPVRTRGTGQETVKTYGPLAEPYREAARLLLL
jgi:hypothetical protein